MESTTVDTMVSEILDKFFRRDCNLPSTFQKFSIVYTPKANDTTVKVSGIRLPDIDIYVPQYLKSVTNDYLDAQNSLIFLLLTDKGVSLEVERLVLDDRVDRFDLHKEVQEYDYVYSEIPKSESILSIIKDRVQEKEQARLIRINHC